MTNWWFVSAIMIKKVEIVVNKKELDDLVSALGENKLSLHIVCIVGTYITILQKIEDKIKNVNSSNII